MSRLAFACAQEKGADVDTLLRKAGLSRTQIEDPHVRISVRSQVVFLDLVAKAVADDLLPRVLQVLSPVAEYLRF
jgi:hypothetical protein